MTGVITDDLAMNRGVIRMSPTFFEKEFPGK